MAKDILALIGSADEQGVLAASELLAKQWRARLTALYLAWQPEPIPGDPIYTAGIWAQLLQDSQAATKRAFEVVKHRLERVDAPVETRCEEVFLGTAEGVVSRHALHADITVTRSPISPRDDAVFEGALFRSGRPVLLVPPGWTGDAIGRRVLIAWKAKREAARALADAEPFLSGSDQVTVVTVDAQPDGYGDGPGRDICTHLAHKGFNVELRNITGMGRTPEVELLKEAQHIRADLLVMGGYGHSRLREFVFGGVTRAISRECPIPVLMSH